MEEERWGRMIYHDEDLGDYYLVSTTGKIKNAKTNKVRKQSINKEGYYYTVISLGSRNNQKNIKIHRAVAETFLGKIDGKEQVNHIDGNKLNNNFTNLEWCNNQENIIHGYKMNLIQNAFKKAVKCLNNNMEFDSMEAAGKWCGVSRNAIANALHNRSKHAGKDPVTNELLSWEWIN